LVALCRWCHDQTDAPYERGRLVVTALGAGQFTFEVVQRAERGTRFGPGPDVCPRGQNSPLRRWPWLVRARGGAFCPRGQNGRRKSCRRPPARRSPPSPRRKNWPSSSGHPPNTTRHCTWARPLLGVSPCRDDSESPDDKHLWAIPSYRAESSPPYVGW